MARKREAIVVGAGPNGLTAAIVLARAGVEVLVVEAHATPGGGVRTGELTLPGFRHDICSAVHPLAVGSPFFRATGLERFGLEWIEPPAAVAQLLADGPAVLLERSVDATAAQLGVDGDAYRELMEPFVERFHELAPMVLGPLRLPSSPLLLARFGLAGIQSIRFFNRHRLRGSRARALLSGIASHTMLRPGRAGTTAFALLLASAGHAVGWPIPRGGSQAIIDALVACLRAHGGELSCDTHVRSLDELPPARAYVLDVTPRQVLAIAGARLPALYRARLERFDYGPGVFKMDWALRGPVPWTDPACARTATLHLAGGADEIAASERAVAEGRLPERPFCLVAQPTLFDRTRAPDGQHTLWAYCHAPHGSTADLSGAIEAQIERFAPGWRDLILARHARTPADLERYNPNYVGGDINGGSAHLGQLFFRPVAKLDPYATPARDVFICSSSTPPGGGVHGMCGAWAARSVLARAFGRHFPERDLQLAL